MDLEAIRKAYNKEDARLFNLAMQRGGSLPWAEYEVLKETKLKQLEDMWNKLSPDLTIEEANKRELYGKPIINISGVQEKD